MRWAGVDAFSPKILGPGNSNKPNMLVLLNGTNEI